MTRTYPTGAIATVSRAPSGNGWLWSVTAPDGATIAEAPRPALTHQAALCSATRAHGRWARDEPPPNHDQRRYAPRPLPRGTKDTWFYDDRAERWRRDFGGGLRGEIWTTIIEGQTYYEWRLRSTKPTPRTVRVATIPSVSMLSARASCYRAFRRYEKST